VNWIVALAALWALLIIPVGIVLGRQMRRVDERRIQRSPEEPAFTFRDNHVRPGPPRPSRR
jgi:hypothetical protein